MKNTKLIEHTIDDILPGDIIKKQRFPYDAAVLMPLGILTIAAIYNVPAIRENSNISSALIFIGAVLTLIGLIRFIAFFAGKGQALYYVPSKERLKCKKTCYNPEDKDKICDMLNKGDTAGIEAMPKTDTSGLQVVTYYAPSGDIALSQAQVYVPHHYVPATDVKIFRRQSINQA